MSAFWAGFEKQAADERSGKTLAGVGAGAAGAAGGYGAYRAATAHYTKPLDGLHKILHEASVRHAMGLGEPRHLGKRVALGAAGAALAGGAAYAGARHLQKKPEAEKTAENEAAKTTAGAAGAAALGGAVGAARGRRRAGAAHDAEYRRLRMAQTKAHFTDTMAKMPHLKTMNIDGKLHSASKAKEIAAERLRAASHEAEKHLAGGRQAVRRGAFKGAVPGALLAGGLGYAAMHHLQGGKPTEKTATKQARLDRLMGALKKRKLPVKDVHAALRSNDLKNQFRGINPHPETSLIKATEHAAETQATGGFSGPWEKARAKGGHE